MPKVKDTTIIKSRMICLKLHPADAAQIERFARASGRSVSAEIRHRLKEVYDEIEQGTTK